MNEYMHGWMDGWKTECMDRIGWMAKWMDG